MDEGQAEAIVQGWSGSSGLVARGPKALLACVPATATDVERHTGRRPERASGLWRIEVGGRFVRSRGVVYPSGVPFPEELHSQTAVIASEAWLYVDQSLRVLGAYWWPQALRRPVAAPVTDDYRPDEVFHPTAISEHVGFDPPLPDPAGLEPVAAVCPGPGEVVVFYTHDQVPDPLSAMLTYEHGGLTYRVRAEASAPDLSAFLRSHQPPFRRISVGGAAGAGRDVGRSLGPQTWPWPAEVWWWADDLAFELKGGVSLAELQAVAAGIDR